MNMNNSELTQTPLPDLSYFYATEQYFFNPLFPNFRYTDGVRYVATEGGAYWLIDSIFSTQLLPAIRKQTFQSWTLKVKDCSAVLSCTNDNEQSVYSQNISFTDFPLPEITFWLVDKVLMLPSEY